MVIGEAARAVGQVGVDLKPTDDAWERLKRPRMAHLAPVAHVPELAVQEGLVACVQGGARQ